MKRLLILTLPFFTLFVGGCKKDKGEGLVTSPAAFFAQNLEDAKQVFTIDPTIYNSLQGMQGVLVQISPNSFVDGQGNLVTEQVTVEFIALFDRTSLFMVGKNTQGMRSPGVVQTMVTGGEYYLNAFSESGQVFLNQDVVVKMATAYGGSGETDMRKFDGANDLNGNPIWEMAMDSLIPIDTVTVDSMEGGNLVGYVPVYSILENNWGWTNIDRWSSDPRPKTHLYVELPEGYDNTNCEVYLSYDGEPNALASFDIWDEERGMFTEHYGQIPIGLECHFIAVTVIDGVLQYAIQGATMHEDHVETITGFSPTTQAELADLIDALP
ncbi:MAG: hypothetical protein GC178_07925 [Flavobacteriales bacterium]|nr:hypothetical protein [Flavobacteriales bacterium]